MFNSDQKRAFVAVLLSGVVLFSWQYFFASKLENKQPVANAKTEVVQPVNSGVTPQAPLNNGNTTAPLANTNSVATLTKVEIKDANNDFKFSNDLSFENSSSNGSGVNLESLSGSKQAFKIQVLTEAGPVDVLLSPKSQTETKFSGESSSLGITFDSELLPDGHFNFKFHSEKPYKYKFLFNAVEAKLDNGQIRKFVTYDNDVTFIDVSKAKEHDGKYKWVGMDFNFHLFALVLKEKSLGKIYTTEQGNMNFSLNEAQKDLEGSLVFTKKNYDHLLSLGDNLHLSVDFGYFALLAVPILRGLQFIYKYIPNYGIAIILLTILIRLITFPLQYKSFKSMKKMQEIQPELQKIKEKYKDDNQKMQKETMALFQKAGANPLSGCLPLLLQMPFFFAIYRVLYSAVELVGAPFFGWIHDLSIHDPFYVLPVLMAASMFMQQKITPQTSVDPTQQKVMMLMPLIFGFIMKNLPAGLVLYIFISTTFGIIQQYLVYKSLD